MEPGFRPFFIQIMQQEFESPAALLAWLQTHVHGANPHDILGNGLFNEQVARLSVWLEAEGREFEVWQLLVNHPPKPGLRLAVMIDVISDQRIRPKGTDMPPVPPHKSLFTTGLPFANRTNLRDQLETLGTAVPGADSVLLIDGERSSGKSYSLRLVRDCATPNVFHSTDFSRWGSVQMHAWDLAGEMFPPALTEVTADKFDATKEEAAVPGLVSWIKGKLHPGPQRWIVIDHCNRPNLTTAAQSFLYHFAAEVAMGSLPEVRLVLADAGTVKLPPELKGKTRSDAADLPDRKAVRDWCDNLARSLNKPHTAAELDSYVNDVFAGFAATPPRSDFAVVLEPRLNEVRAKIRAHS